MTAATDFATLIATLSKIQPTELGRYPTARDINEVSFDCQIAVEAVAELVKARMEAVQHQAGTVMNAAGHASDLTGIFADSIRPQFYAAERAIEDAEPARAARAA